MRLASADASEEAPDQYECRRADQCQREREAFALAPHASAGGAQSLEQRSAISSGAGGGVRKSLSRLYQTHHYTGFESISL